MNGQIFNPGTHTCEQDWMTNLEQLCDGGRDYRHSSSGAMVVVVG